MKNATLRVGRRSCFVKGRLILRTSFIWTRECTTVTADWHEVQGSIALGCMAGFDAPNLEVIGGHLRGDVGSRLNCPKLEIVHGDYDIPGSDQVIVPNLREVAGNLRAAFRNFPLLEIVGGEVWIRHVPELELPNLRTVGGSLNAADCTKFAAMKLVKVGHALASAIPIAPTSPSPRAPAAHGSMNVEAAKEIIARSLTEVTGNLDTSSAASFAPQRLRVGGSWNMHPNARAILTACRMAYEALKENPDLHL